MIYIIRHGQTDLNVKKIMQGRSDYPLNEAGRSQAKEIAEYFKENGITFDKIYSSPLKRAMETARIIAGNEAEIITDDRLIEMDYGPYEGTDLNNPPEEIVTFFQDFVNNEAPEGMEALSSVVARMGSFIQSLEQEEDQKDKNILIAAHAISMKGALEYTDPDAKGRYWSTYIGNCSIYKIDVKTDGSGGYFVREL